MKLFFITFTLIKVKLFKSFSSLSSLLSKSNVFVSKSRDIFKNLSFETWLFQNYPKLVKDDLNFLIVWFNSTAAVIGRHQNPWNEIWVKRCFQNKVPIVRRNSGGGTVIHDLQNLNICFLSHRQFFDRSQNMNMIKNVLKEKYNIESYVGTAAKIGSKAAYHHCTLLVDANLDIIYSLIKPPQNNILSNATSSIPATIGNLKTHCPEVEINQLISYLSEAFITSQTKPGSIIEIEPDNDKFLGIDKIEKHLKSWDWIFGKTPKFSIISNFKNCQCQVTISHGLIEKVEFNPSINSDLNLNGIQFTYKEVESALNYWCLHNKETEKVNICKKLIIDILNQAYS